MYHYHNFCSLPFAVAPSVINKTVTKVSRYPCTTPIVKLRVPSPSEMLRFVLRNPITATEFQIYITLMCKRQIMEYDSSLLSSKIVILALLGFRMR